MSLPITSSSHSRVLQARLMGLASQLVLLQLHMTCKVAVTLEDMQSFGL